VDCLLNILINTNALLLSHGTIQFIVLCSL